MVLRSMLYGAAVKSDGLYDRHYSIIQRPLTEKTILQLQDIFLTNGIHHIVVDDVLEGRYLIKTLLASLNCYHAIAALTVEPLTIQIPVFDMYRELMRNNDICEMHIWESFFVDQFYFDFMWIELSEDLTKTAWMNHFEQQLMDLKLEFQLPIICIRYSE